MKKFLMFVTFLIFLIPAVVTQAADIPDIRSLNDKAITFKESKTYGANIFVYKFRCSDKKGKVYGNAYINYLTNKLNFKLLKHVEHHEKLEYDDWYFAGARRNIAYPDYDVFVSFGDNHLMVMVNNGFNMSGYQNKNQSNTTSNTPAQSNTNANSGSDVPDFGAVSGIYGKSEPKSGYMLFSYECALGTDNANNFAAKYINLLTTKYNFRQANHTVKTTMSGHCQVDEWQFVYTGNNKNIGSTSQGYSLQLKRRRFNANAKIFANKAIFNIEVAQNLTYGNKTVKPVPRSGGQNPCTACNGDGKCKKCGGSGYRYEWNGVLGINEYGKCGNCSDGKCNQCGGRGYL